ncbi:Flp family type IVb pilin [Alsobacter sp. SYSU M60028]|uniref:Flp family type IVb pilin n=1 Tax=Alsobacter ponti TaxID=2962936 RepID=A0ABT1LBJ6_9HYPH|nr:Flp family type IVb pilin [Alsobacter ponti]MCP8938135.1 Flp family type IVb pilin [Alsobacter ponti]
MLALLSRFAGDERANTTVEFGLIGGIIMIGLIGAFASLRGNLQMTFQPKTFP